MKAFARRAAATLTAAMLAACSLVLGLDHVSYGPREASDAGPDATAGDGADSVDGGADALACGDARNDPLHCGACGRACRQGVPCTDGVCASIVIADAGVEPGPIFTTSGIAQLFWIERREGRLLRCANKHQCLETAGGVSVIRDGTFPVAFDGDGLSLYWLERGNDAGAPPDIEKCRYDQCNVVSLDASTPLFAQVDGFALVGAYAFFGVRGSGPVLARCAKGSCLGTFDAWTTSAIPSRISSVPGQTPRVVLLEGNFMRSCDVSCDAGPTILLTGGGLVSPSGTTDAVYFGSTNRATIETCDFNDGGCAVLVRDAGTVHEVVTGGGSVYWSTREADGGGALLGCARTGCAAPTILAADTSAGGLAFDGEYVYWSDARRGKIFRTPKLD